MREGNGDVTPWWDDEQIIYKGNELGLSPENHIIEVHGVLSQFCGAILEAGDVSAS